MFRIDISREQHSVDPVGMATSGVDPVGIAINAARTPEEDEEVEGSEGSREDRGFASTLGQINNLRKQHAGFRQGRADQTPETQEERDAGHASTKGMIDTMRAEHKKG